MVHKKFDVGLSSDSCLILRKTKLAREISRCLLPAAISFTPIAFAQSDEETEAREIEKIEVTATKRPASLQEVPLSITALQQGTLDDLNITDFGDYVQQIPSVSFTERRPGAANVFIRGISEGGNGNQSLQGPSAAIYLNEQPVTGIGLNLDVHIYDIERVEVLKGPQGTLYGAASQSGTLRIITNKPNTESFDAGFDVTLESTQDGDLSYMLEGFANMPISDNVALRVVTWFDDDGGFIDNVEDTITFPVSGISRNNNRLVEDDFNTLDKKGLRAALKVDLNDNWTATASVAHQDTSTNGIWDHDPRELGDLNVSRFTDDRTNDEWSQFSMVVEGDVGFADLTYAGSYLDRDYEVYSDYSAYSVSSAYVEPYYTCYAPYYVNGACVDPSIQFSNPSTTKNQTHEIRLSSSTDRIDWIIGGFYYDQELDFELNYTIPGLNPLASVDAAAAIRGSRSDLTEVYFLTDQTREDSEMAIFGELTYRITDKLSGTIGYRLFDGESTLRGVSGTIFTANPVIDNTIEYNDGTGKVNLSYSFSDDILFYATWSEGYRPGGANRVSSVLGADYDPDFLTSYEIGWKTTLLNNRLRFNGAVFTMDWDEIQIGFFDASIAQVGLVDNIGTAQSSGIELDATWLVTDDLQITAAYAHNQAELTEDYFSNAANTTPDAFDGQDLPFTPDNKATLTAKYYFDIGEYYSTVQANWSYTDSMYNDIFFENREEQDAYSLVAASWRIEGDSWHASLFVDNLTNEVAELFINNFDARRLVTVNRPRTFGINFGMKFY